MKKFLFVSFIWFLFLMVQILLPFRIDFLLIATIFFGINYGVKWGDSFGFFSGLTQDIFLPSPFGRYALIKTIIGFLAGKLRGKVAFNLLFTQFLAGAVFFLLQGVLAAILGLIFASSTTFLSLKIIKDSLVNGIFACLLFFILEKVRKSVV